MTARLAPLRSLVLLAAVSLMGLVACAPPLKDPWGLAVVRAHEDAHGDARGDAVLSPPPHTLQADLTVTAHVPGAIPLSSRLYAEPGRRYRLDIFGLFTPVVASWAWYGAGHGAGHGAGYTADTLKEPAQGPAGDTDEWLLVRHDTREVVTGTGTSFIPLAASGKPVMIPDVHAVLGFLWGQPLPGFDGTSTTSPARGAGEGGREGGAVHEVRWVHGGRPWSARFDRATGLCLEASSPDMTVRYGRHARQGERVLPREADVWIDGARVLTLSVRTRRENPVWQRDPFVLTIPAGYDSTAF